MSLEKLSEWIDHIPLAVGASVVVVGGVIELLFRMIKTEKPKSLAYFVADLFKLLSKGFGKLGAYLDAVLPQRLKSDVVVAPKEEPKV